MLSSPTVAAKPVGVEIDQHDFRAFRQQGAHGGETETAGTAGHNAGFTFDQSQRFPPLPRTALTPSRFYHRRIGIDAAAARRNNSKSGSPAVRPRRPRHL